MLEVQRGTSGTFNQTVQTSSAIYLESNKEYSVKALNYGSSDVIGAYSPQTYLTIQKIP
jgi:hypothetical protein